MIRMGLKKLFSHSISNSFYDDLEDLLIEADLSVSLACDLRAKIAKEHPKSDDDAVRILRQFLKSYLVAADLQLEPKQLNMFLLLGVNGVGKTTSIAKLARYYKEKQGIGRISAAAADTFRAAAVEQLVLHGGKGDFRVVGSSTGGDPGSVIHDAISSAIAQHDQLLLADTAGRMHNKADLVNELKKIDKIIKARIEPKCYKKILVIDATTGQNGVRQAEVFNEALSLSGIILTKYDSTARGGSLAAIGQKLALPIFFLGKGEAHDDLEGFNAESYLDDLLS